MGGYIRASYRFRGLWVKSTTSCSESRAAGSLAELVHRPNAYLRFKV